MKAARFKAKLSKNDEFYTQYSTVEEGLKPFRDEFIDKIVYLNCDDPSFSQFWAYFKNNFKQLQLKKLISTYLAKDSQSFKTEMCLDASGEIKETKTQLLENGSYDSQECINELQNCDIVVTNPPFSKLRNFMDVLIKSQKNFIIIAPVTYPSTLQAVQFTIKRQVEFSAQKATKFNTPTETQKQVTVTWATNILGKVNKRKTALTAKYYGNEGLYPKYDNKNAINVNKIAHIPGDYYELMGVPITFLLGYDTSGFNILGLNMPDIRVGGSINLYTNETPVFARIIIQRKQNEKIN